MKFAQSKPPEPRATNQHHSTLCHTQEREFCEKDDAAFVSSGKAKNADEALASARLSNACRRRKIKSSIRKPRAAEYIAKR